MEASVLQSYVEAFMESTEPLDRLVKQALNVGNVSDDFVFMHALHFRKPTGLRIILQNAICIGNILSVHLHMYIIYIVAFGSKMIHIKCMYTIFHN